MQVFFSGFIRRRSHHWRTLWVIAISLYATVSSAFAEGNEFGQCRHLFAHGSPPVIQQKDAQKTRSLCYEAFAVLHSGRSRTPVFVAQRLNRAMLLAARDVRRANRFFADARLPRSERAGLEDYQGSGFDRGHMAPAGDMATDASMAQSFSLANTVPQSPLNNRKSWAAIEKATRKYVMRAAGDVFVITGPVFDGTPPTIGTNRVWVPQHLFKLVYDPSAGRAWAHWLDNSDDVRLGKPISYEELVLRTRIEFLPGWMEQNHGISWSIRSAP